jgi:hypothetical protein
METFQSYDKIQLPSKKQIQNKKHTPIQQSKQIFVISSHVEPPKPSASSPTNLFIEHLDKRINFY